MFNRCNICGSPSNRPGTCRQCIRILLTTLVFALAMVALAVTAEGSDGHTQSNGLYAVVSSQQCRSGNCPLVPIAKGNHELIGSCVCVGVTRNGVSCVLTAAHVVSGQGQYQVQNGNGTRYPARVIWRDGQIDVACLSVNEKLQATALAGRYVRDGDEVKLEGVLSGRYEKSFGQVIGSSKHQVLADPEMWAHPGMSGGPVSLADTGGLIGVMIGARVSPDSHGKIFTNWGATELAINRFESRLGPLSTVIAKPRKNPDPPEGASRETAPSPPGNTSGEVDDLRDKVEDLTRQLEQTSQASVSLRAELQARIEQAEQKAARLAEELNQQKQAPPAPDASPTEPPSETVVDTPHDRSRDGPVVPGREQQAGDAAQGEAQTQSEGQQSSPLDGWSDVAKTVGKVAIYAAAPEVAIPATTGLSALGGIWAWWRRRKKRKPGAEAVATRNNPQPAQQQVQPPPTHNTNQPPPQPETPTRPNTQPDADNIYYMDPPQPDNLSLFRQTMADVSRRYPQARSWVKLFEDSYNIKKSGV